MKLIHHNPYRVAGILSNATARELQKQKAKIKAYSEVGKEITSEYDFDFIENITRTENSINKAFSAIQQHPDKVNNSLFWFLNASPSDNKAIEYLKNGNAEKAMEKWEKVTRNKEVNSKNFSAFNNLGTYKLLSQSEGEIKAGIEAKIKLIESDYFENFAHSVADETFTINNDKQIEKLVDALLVEFKNQYSSTEIVQLFSNCNGTTQKYLSKKFTEEPIYNIESQIESTKNKRKENENDAYDFGLRLANNTREELALLQSLLGENDLKYKMIADNLAKEIMQCGIDYFKQWKDSKDPSVKGLRLLKYAQTIAVGNQTKDRVKENIEGIEDWVETAPIKEVIDEFLRNVKNIEKEVLTEKDSEKNNNFKKSIQKRRVNSSENLIVNILNLHRDKVMKNDAVSIINMLSFAINAIQNQLVIAVNEAQETKSKIVRPVMQDNGSFSLQAEDSIDTRNFKEIVGLSLDVSFLTFKFKITENASNYRNQNQHSLIDIAKQLNLSTKSPGEKTQVRIDDLKSRLSKTKDKTFDIQKLTETENQLKEIKIWKLFRSKERKESEINQKFKCIEIIKRNGESEKRLELKRIEKEIIEQKNKLQKLRL